MLGRDRLEEKLGSGKSVSKQLRHMATRHNNFNSVVEGTLCRAVCLWRYAHRVGIGVGYVLDMLLMKTVIFEQKLRVNCQGCERHHRQNHSY